MEKLIKDQEETGEKIIQLDRNYRKDPADRKTTKYLEQRIATLKSLYNDYVRVDDQIRAFKPELNASHEYYNKRASIADKYKTSIDDMRQRLNNFPSVTPTTSVTMQPLINNTLTSNEFGSKTDEEQPLINNTLTSNEFGSKTDEEQSINKAETSKPTIEVTNNKLMKRQDILMRQMYKNLASINYAMDTDNISKEYINLKIKQLEKELEVVSNQHTAILVELEDDEQTSNYFFEDYFGNLQNQVEVTIIKLQQHKSGTTTTTAEASQIRLPKVEIPLFYGEYERWETFNDMFTELVHRNNKLTDIVKMQYLKTHVMKGAAQLISHLSATGDNYKAAWDIIQDRYNNARLLANHQFNALLSLTTLQAASAQSMRNLHDTAKEILHNIYRLKMSSPFEAFVGFILCKKMDPESIRLYETTSEKPREVPQLEEIFKFMERRFQSLEAMGNQRPTTTRPQYTPPPKRVYTATAASTCYVERCKEQHSLHQCRIFKNMTTLERSRLVNLKNLCKSCLSQHQGSYCKAEACVVCKGAHHTLLHCNNAASSSSSKTFMVNQQGQVLLPTAVVRAKTGTDNFVALRVLVDPGSQATLISARAANLLNFKKKKTYVTISGIGGAKAGVCRHTINIQLSPTFDGEFQLNIEALIFDKLNQQLPEEDFNTDSWVHLKQIQLADPHFNQSQPIDLILGADYYPTIIKNNIIKGGQLEPMAQDTEFGYIIIGSRSDRNVRHKTTMVSNKIIEGQLRLLIDNDSVPEERTKTEEEIKVEVHFQSTVEKGSDGRYIVKIPLKDNHVALGESRKRAAARLIQIEKRFKKDAHFKQLYHKFMQEYINLKHMEPVQEKIDDDKASNIYYIPHHGVFKNDSTTTKLRVVFDASSKTTTGASLNDCMMNGPKLQEDLAEILLRWRKHKIVMTADIEKMYRQTWINEQDQNFQRILWRTHPSKPMEAYKLRTVTYGTTAASFLAIRALQLLASEGASEYPTASNIMLADFYVDDLLTGCDNMEQAIQALQELKALTEKGGLNLRKWFSNSKDLLKHIPRELHGKGNMQIKLNDCIKTLGILYDPQEDSFRFDIKKLQLSSKRPTKRSLLSDSSKLFDPVGWLSPITIAAKIMMQEVWTTGIEWDDPLPEKINVKWTKYKEELEEIRNITIRRWINTTSKAETQLHGFADASEDAYAAAIYCRTLDEKGIITTQLLISKTRVAPTKTKLSIPRLELNATLLLAKLLKHVQGVLKINNIETYAWSDSTIALCWITGEPSKFKTFVANRISAIRTILPTTTWHHVKSCDNPADIASRGTTPLALTKNKLWWEGPEFLRQKLMMYKEIDLANPSFTNQQQELKQKSHEVLTIRKGNHALIELFERCSSYNRLKRIVAYCKRFINNSIRRNNNKKELIASELQIAELTILKVVQEQDFHSEISCLKHAKEINKKSKILSLNPTLDENGLLRASGRLQNSMLPSASRNPVILDKNNIVTQRIIEDAHISTLHGGTQLTLSHLRNKYWVIDGKRAVRQIVNKCIICFRHKQQQSKQLMGNLPSSRVRPGRPFAKTGIDYAGPIQLRTTKGRGHKTYKGYIALFICMVTKAVHIEIVSSLTTDDFIAAYKRFISRRGLCTDIYSDNGTYFIGANAAMKKNYHTALTKLPTNIATMLASEGTTWHFIPPHSPHFGGIWEAGIKSVKFHLKRVIGESTLTFEELYTVVTQIEACLNSRPITPLTNDVSDLAALTPGHFLIGDSLKALPCANIDNMGLRSRWHMVERVVQDFWKRWSSEYLHQLHQRNKWMSAQPNLEENDLVLIKDDQQPATRWKLGRVLYTHPGEDNRVRVATVKCKDAVYKRPIVKLCKLPIDDEARDSLPIKTISPSISTTPKKTTSSTYENNSLAPRQQPDRRVKHMKRNNYFILAMLSVCCCLGLVQAEIQITAFNQSTGIFFEELGKLEVVAMKWTILIHYNMSNYWEEIEIFKQAHTELQAVCNELPRINCNIIIQQLQWRLNNLIADNVLLLESNKERRRVKRDFGDTTGIVLSDMFGLLSQREAHEYEAHFETISKNENHLLALIKNQTSVIDNTIKLVRHNSNLTITSLNNLIKNQQRLRQEMVLLQEYQTYEERVRSVLVTMLELTLVLNNLEDTQQGLLDIMYHAHQGNLHPSILSPVQLEDELQLIRQHIPASIAVPGHNIQDLTHVYQSMNIRSRVTQRNIIIEIILPLSFTWDYTLFSLISVPDIIHGNTQSYIITSANYLAVDSRREHVAFLTREEVNHCQALQPMQFLCEISPIVNTMTNRSQCEIAIMQRKPRLEAFCNIGSTTATNHWIKLNAPNQWIYVVPYETTVDVICGSKIKSHNLQGSGVVEINAGCMLRDADHLIIAVGAAHNNINKDSLKITGLIHGVKNLNQLSSSIKNKALEVDNLELITTPETSDLDNQLASLRNNEVLIDDPIIHHIHHYAMIHIVFWSFLAIVIFWSIRKLHKKRTHRKHIAPLPRVEESYV